MRVLLASGDMVAGRILEGALAGLGHEVQRLTDGEAAWAAIPLFNPDVVLSDWVMPGLDGLQLCRKIREREGEAYIYFVLVTAAERRANLDLATEAGIDDYLSKPIDLTELAMRLHVAQRITTLQRQLAERNVELENTNRQLFEVGRRDGLTELWNRRQLREDLEQMTTISRRYHRVVSIGMCDVDHFKQYNDRHGHVQGDEVLRRIAHVLESGSRATDRAYRYGGEEFIVTFPEVDLAGALVAMTRLANRVRELAIPHPGVGPREIVTISAGVTQFDPRVDADVEAWLERTDRLLYAAKDAGRDQVHAGGA